MTMRTIDPNAEVAGLVDQFGSHRASLPGAGQSWLESLREAGIARFAEIGFPGPKVEAWKYTNLNALKKLAFEPPIAADTAIAIDSAPTLLAGNETAHRLVFVNGSFRPELSRIEQLPDGVVLGDLGASLARGDEAVVAALGQVAPMDGSPLSALNTAMMQDGYVLRLDKGANVERPIEIVQLTVPGDRLLANHPRNLIIAEAGSRATILEHYTGLGTGSYWLNSVCEVHAKRGAKIRLYKAQTQSHEAFHFDQTTVLLEEDGHFECFALMLGAKLARNEIRVRLGGATAACALNGAYALSGKQHCDTLTDVDHAEVGTISRQVFKGVLDGSARAVFQGKVLVRPGAQGTDGQQLNKTLLLSDKAEIDTKPELEIRADDVKCSHGATAGELDRDAVFYLQSRGIPETEARDLLVEAFLDEVVAEISDETVREAFKVSIFAWLAARSEGRER